MLFLFACTPDDTADSAEEPVVAELIAVSGGSFTMGCDDCDDDEAPAHVVTLHGYTLDAYEVTQGQYAECVDAAACPPAGMSGASNLPVTGVEYESAAAFCAWRQLRVPTEAEWEYAARGSENLIFPWGNEWTGCDPVVQRLCDGGLQTVGSRPEGDGPFGHHDLAGNAWEWVSDLYDATYYTVSPEENPQGPTAAGLRSVRGTDAWSDYEAVRSSNRTYAIPGGAGSLVGFRCAGDAP